MKTEKKSQKAIAVIILLTVGLVYNYADYSQVLHNYKSNSNINEGLSYKLENNRVSFVTFTTDILKSRFNSIF